MKKLSFLTIVLSVSTQLSFSAYMETRGDISRPLEYMGSAIAVKASSNGHLAVVSPSGEINVWDMNPDRRMITGSVKRTGYQVGAGLALSSNGYLAVYNINSGDISLFNVNSGEENKRIPVPMMAVENMSFSDDNSALICYSSLDQSIVTYDIETGEQTNILKFEYINPALDISLAAGSGLGALSVDGQKLASFDRNNNSIRIDDLNTKQMTHNLSLEKGLSFMPGSLVLDSHNNRVGAILADITQEGRTAHPRALYMILWDLDSGKQLCKFNVGLFVVNPHLWTLLGAERIISAFHGDITRWDLEQLAEQQQ